MSDLIRGEHPALPTREQWEEAKHRPIRSEPFMLTVSPSVMKNIAICCGSIYVVGAQCCECGRVLKKAHHYTRRAKRLIVPLGECLRVPQTKTRP